jgi:hypothetical protein
MRKGHRILAEPAGKGDMGCPANRNLELDDERIGVR